MLRVSGLRAEGSGFGGSGLGGRALEFLGFVLGFGVQGCFRAALIWDLRSP